LLYCLYFSRQIIIFNFCSSNLSKAAWGYFDYKNNFNIISYELGVLFLPKYESNHPNEGVESEYFDLAKNEFSLPYDLPPVKYDSTGTYLNRIDK
jgi:hypothetical protein